MGHNGMARQDMEGYSMLHDGIKPMTVTGTYELRDENGNVVESGPLEAPNSPLVNEGCPNGGMVQGDLNEGNLKLPLSQRGTEGDLI